MERKNYSAQSEKAYFKLNYMYHCNQIKHQGSFNMDCPRCGTPMEGGVCPNCGFPVIRRYPKDKMNRIVFPIKHFLLFHVDSKK